MRLLTCLLAGAFAALPVLAQEVTATGQGTSESEAIRIAFRSAVEQAGGAFIESRRQAHGFELVKDQLLYEAKDFVSHYQVTTTRQSASIVEVTLQATIARAALIERWTWLEGALRQAGRPRIRIVTRFRHAGALVPAPELEAALARPFVEAGCFVLASSPPAGARGADLLLALDLDGTELGRSAEAYGGEALELRLTHAITISRVSDARVLYSNGGSLPFSIRDLPSRVSLASGAFDLCRWLAPFCRRKLIAAWAFQPIGFELVVSRLPYSEAASLRAWIGKQPWTIAVAQERYERGTLSLRVESRHTRTAAAADALAAQEAVPLEIAGVDPTTIRARPRPSRR